MHLNIRKDTVLFVTTGEKIITHLIRFIIIQQSMHSKQRCATVC
jgi:hypothetical protein